MTLNFRWLISSNKFSGDDSIRATPVPIPNTAVKPNCGDDTWAVCLGKVAHLQNFYFIKAQPFG